MPFWNTTKKILIIDDDHSLLRRASIHLKKQKNFEIVVFDNAREGVAAAKSLKPHLIILDWKLPDIQGIDVLPLLRKSDKTKSIPVLMLTGKNKIGNIEDAFERGANAYIIKPFSLKKLSEKVIVLMKKKSAT